MRDFLKTPLQMANICLTALFLMCTPVLANEQTGTEDLFVQVTQAEMKLIDIQLTENLKHQIAYRDAILAIRATDRFQAGDQNLTDLIAELGKLLGEAQKSADPMTVKMAELKSLLPDSNIPAMDSTVLLAQLDAEKLRFESWLNGQSN